MFKKILWIILIILLVGFASRSWTVDLLVKVDFNPQIADPDYPFEYQYIDGFGAVAYVALKRFFAMSDEHQNLVLDKLFLDDELGANLIRFDANRNLCPDAQNCGNVTLAFMPEDLHFLKEARERNPNIKLSAAPLGAPSWMVDTWTNLYPVLCRFKVDRYGNPLCTPRGCDDNDCLDEHAFWLYSYLNAYEHGNFYLGVPYGAPIQYFSLQCEPDWKGNLQELLDWTCFCEPPEYGDRFDAFKVLFDNQKDVTKPEIIIAETFHNCKNMGDYSFQVLNNTGRALFANILGNHIYHGYYFWGDENENCPVEYPKNFCCGDPEGVNGQVTCNRYMMSDCHFCFPLGCDYYDDGLDECCRRYIDNEWQDQYIEDIEMMFDQSRCRVTCEQQIGKWGTKWWSYNTKDLDDIILKHFRVWMTEQSNLTNAIKYQNCRGCPAPLASQPPYYSGIVSDEFQQALNLAAHIHFTMVCEKASAFSYLDYIQNWDELPSGPLWNFFGWGLYAIDIDNEGETYQLQRCEHNYHAMKHYSRFIKEGFQRVQALVGVPQGGGGSSWESDQCRSYIEYNSTDELFAQLLVSSYKKMSGNNLTEIVIVIINYHDTLSRQLEISLEDIYQLRIQDIEFETYQSRRGVLSNTYWQDMGTLTQNNGKYYITVQNASITTLHWVLDSHPPGQ